MINKSYKLTFLLLTLFSTNLSAGLLKFGAELYRISKIGDRKADDIRSNAFVGKISNICTALWLPIIGIPRLLSTTSSETEALANGINVAPSFTSLNFYTLDQELSENAKAIAKYNKKTKRDVGDEKNQQRLWLIANYLIPFISASFFAGEYFAQDRNESEIEYFIRKLEHVNRKNALIEALTNISEVIRQYYKYKADFGDYRNFTGSNSFDTKALKNLN